jgi:hypothetical protein
MALVDMPSDDTAHVHLVVDPDRKSLWESHAEENENFSSLSGLIRTAVEKEVSGEFGANEDRHDEIIENLTHLREQISKINHDIDYRILEEIVGTDEMEDLLETTVDEMIERQREEVYDDGE